MNRLQKINAAIQNAQGRTSGLLGVGFIDLNGGGELYLNAEHSFPSASAFKVFLLAELVRQCEAGILSLGTREVMTEDIKSPGSGVIFELQAGLALTLEDYAKLMMMLSDNTATDLLYKIVGRDNIVNNILKPYGLENTKCDLPCRELIETYYETTGGSPSKSNYRRTAAYLGELERDDVSTPTDMARMLNLMYENKLCSPFVSQKMIDIMKICQTNSRIPKYLPKGTEVAHKTGTMDKVANDVGIVYTEKGNYILALFFNGNLADEQEYLDNFKGNDGDSLLAALSREIYDIYVAQ